MGVPHRAIARYLAQAYQVRSRENSLYALGIADIMLHVMAHGGTDLDRAQRTRHGHGMRVETFRA